MIQYVLNLRFLRTIKGKNSFREMNPVNYTKTALVYSMLIVLFGSSLFGQNRKELEEQKTKTQQEIEYTNNLLQATQENRRSTTQRVRILNKRIQLRNEIINNVSQEVGLIDHEIAEKEALIDEMERDLETIKKQYAEMIVTAYWNRSKRDWLMFIMSAENFNQAYRRMKYLQQFSEHRRQQALLIDKMKGVIVEEIEELELSMNQKEELLIEKRNENNTLEREKRSKNRLVSDLVQKERELRNNIEEKRRIAEKLEKEIAAIIAEEARKARSGRIYDQMTPEERLISDNFQGNKGKLPWPVERGVITEKFGVHQHPVLKQVTVENDGVDITTVEGAKVRAMFDGEVTKIVSILGSNYAIILRHGNFLSVYQNIVDLNVEQGDKVRTKDVLGTVYTDNEANKTVLHMQIWKERAIQDPEEWISR